MTEFGGESRGGKSVSILPSSSGTIGTENHRQSSRAEKERERDDSEASSPGDWRSNVAVNERLKDRDLQQNEISIPLQVFELSSTDLNNDYSSTTSISPTSAASRISNRRSTKEKRNSHESICRSDDVFIKERSRPGLTRDERTYGDYCELLEARRRNGIAHLREFR